MLNIPFDVGNRLFLDSARLLYAGCFHSQTPLQIQSSEEGRRFKAGEIRSHLIVYANPKTDRFLLLPLFDQNGPGRRFLPFATRFGTANWCLSPVYYNPDCTVLVNSFDIVFGAWIDHGRPGLEAQHGTNGIADLSWLPPIDDLATPCHVWPVPGPGVDSGRIARPEFPEDRADARFRANFAVELWCQTLVEYGVARAVASPNAFKSYFWRDGRNYWPQLIDSRSQEYLCALIDRLRKRGETLDWSFDAQKSIQSDDDSGLTSS